MLINLGLKSLARLLTTHWVTSKTAKRRATWRNLCSLPVEFLESRALLTNFVVTTANDDSATDTGLSLREAIDQANNSEGADTITFDSSLSGQRILTSLGQLTISDPLTITGLGASATVIDAQLGSRVFGITDTAGNVTFDSLTVTGGQTSAASTGGAGIYSFSSGTFTLTNSAVTANSTSGSQAQGGGIYSLTGPVVLINSTVAGNSTIGPSAPGGGIATVSAPVTLINSTISGNTTQGANSSGGGIATYTGNIKAVNTTIAFNGTGGATAGGGGLFSGGNGSQQTNSITLNNTILADNTAGQSTADDFFQGAGVTGLFVNSSLIGINTGSSLGASPSGSPDSSGNFIGTSQNPIDPLLGALQINGGETRTHALLAGSPAINGGDNSLADDQSGSPLTTDQTGAARIIGGTVDMGSFEGVNAASGPSITFSAATQTAGEGDGTVTLTVTLSASSSQQITIPFTVTGTATSGADYTISSSPLVIPANTTTATIQISLTDDSATESNETVIVTLGTPSTGTLGNPSATTVTIVDNDGGQSGGPTDITLSSQTVAENFANAVVGTLAASDDNGATNATFTIQPGGQGDQFVISGNQLKVGPNGLDFESLSGGVANITIRATDDQGDFFDKSFSITVTDVNEAPTITANQTFSVPAFSPVGTEVGTIVATDPDTTAPNKTLTYIIVSGNTDNAFAINSTTGQITVANQSALNSSTPPFNLQIEVDDGGNPSLNATETVQITVGTSGSENTAPSIASGQFFTTSEGRGVGAIVGTVVATDPDSTAPENTLTYSITGGNTNDAFSIDSATGQIKINTPSAVDFETTPQFVLQIKVADGGSPSLSATANVTINVTNVNDAPVIADDQSFGVALGSTAGTVVGIVQATDDDASAPDNTLTYSIASGNTGNAFAINASTGEITVVTPSALGSNSPFTLGITVTDGGTPARSDTKSVTINVTSTNQPPVIPAGQEFTLDENAASNTVVGTVAATDPDTSAPENTLLYSIAGGNPNSAFAINPATGEITVSNPTALDFETTSQFTLQVRVVDGGDPALGVTQDVKINLNDVNEIPVVASGQTFTVSQNTPSGTSVGTVDTNDPDTTAPNNTLTYSILSGNNNNAFTIDSTTGEIKVANGLALDPSVNPQFNLTIRVVDGGTPNLATTQTVTVIVSSVNHAPVIPAGQSFSISDQAANNSLVGTVIATDSDTTAPNNSLTYSIISGNTDNAFSINPLNGRITVNDASVLNSATTPQYTLQVQVADGGDPSLTATQSVIVNVGAPGGENSAPSIVPNQTFSIPEFSNTNTPVGTVIASDPDTSAPNNTLTYSIVAGNFNNAFAIDPATGLITVATPAALNSGTNPQFSLQVQVTDGGSPSLSDTRIVTVNVTGSNQENHGPSIAPNQSFTVAPNPSGNTVVGTVIATDPDTSAPDNTINYLIVGGNTNNAFAINFLTGEITVSTPSAVTAGASFALQIEARDGGSPPLSDIKIVTITVDAGNQPPVVPAGQIFTVDVNSPDNTVVGTVQANDPDATPPNNTLSYSIASGNGSGAFAIDPATGQITVANSAALGSTTSFTLEITVADGGNPSLSQTQEIVINVSGTGSNQPPTIPAGQQFTIAENPSQNAVVGTVSASDPDTTAPDNTLTYSIVSGNTAGAFAIDPVTGQITVSNPAAVNFDTNPQFALQVQVVDGGSPQLSATQLVTVHVTDTGTTNNPPSIPSGQTFTVSTPAADNAAVGTVNATDPDGAGPNGTLTYSIVSGNPNGVFAINPSTGQITVANAAVLNGASTAQYTLQVQVTDAGTPQLSATQDVTINVNGTGTPNNPPSIPAGQTLSVDENSATSTIVGTVIATDPDSTAPDNTLTYSIVSGNTNNAFSIDPATGQISVNNSSGLNFESQSQFTLRVQVSDGGDPSLSATSDVTINVTNVNEPPAISAGQSLSVSGSAPMNTVVGTVQATDPDLTAPNNTLTYSISGGNTDNAFQINPQTGQITVANSAALTAGNSPFSLQVVAVDAGTPSLSATQTITVTVTNTNPNQPPSIPAGQIFTIPENPANARSVGIVSATDPDPTAPNNMLTYSIVGGNSNNAFTINSATGQITVTNPGAVDFETSPQFNLQVQVTDGGNPAQSATQLVTVNVTDVNEAPDVPADQSFSVVEHSAANTVIGTVIATDPDTTAPNNTLTYSITSGNANQAVAINPTTGQITVTNPAALNFATSPTLTLVVKATDGGGLSTSESVVINVTQANPTNHAPVLTNSGTPPVYERHGRDSVVVLPEIVVTDPDSPTDLGRVVISLPTTGRRNNPDRVGVSSLTALGMVNFATVDGRQQITVNLRTGVTNDEVQSALRGVTFSTKRRGLKLGHRDFQVQVVDRQGAASAVVTQDIQVTGRSRRQRT